MATGVVVILVAIIGIASYGAMIGTAMLYPMALYHLADREGDRFCSIVLAIFLAATAVSHAIFFRSFLQYGVRIASIGFFILLHWVLCSADAHTHIVPYFPLFAVVLSLTTLTITELLGDPPSADYHDEANKGAQDRIDAHNQHRQNATAMMDSNLAGISRDPPQYPDRSVSGTSDLSLSSTPPQVRQDWDYQTRNWFPGPCSSLNVEHTAPPDLESGQDMETSRTIDDTAGDNGVVPMAIIATDSGSTTLHDPDLPNSRSDAPLPPWPTSRDSSW